MARLVVDPEDDDVLAVLIGTEQVFVRWIDCEVSRRSAEARDELDELEGAVDGVDRIQRQTVVAAVADVCLLYTSDAADE